MRDVSICSSVIAPASARASEMSPNTSSTKLSYVPDSSPGAVTSSEASGYGAFDAPNSSPSASSSSAARSLASLQFAKPSDSGPSSAYRSRKLRQVTSVLSALVTTDSPSKATCSSTYSTPFSSHSATSSSLIARDASLMSVSPLQKSWKPSPVPGPSTVYWKSGFWAANSSATRLVMGLTVDEPETKISPAAPPAASVSSAISVSSAAG